jgi:hypothetical protein
VQAAKGKQEHEGAAKVKAVKRGRAHLVQQDGLGGAQDGTQVDAQLWGGGGEQGGDEGLQRAGLSLAQACAQLAPPKVRRGWLSWQGEGGSALLPWHCTPCGGRRPWPRTGSKPPAFAPHRPLSRAPSSSGGSSSKLLWPGYAEGGAE